MFLLISFILSVALAIPTFGISLVIFFLIKHSIDKKAANYLLANVKMAEDSRYTRITYGMNKGAISKAFRMTSRDFPHITGHKNLTAYCGLMMHPLINGGFPVSVEIVYVTRFPSSSALVISLANGKEDYYLSGNNFEFNAIEADKLNMPFIEYMQTEYQQKKQHAINQLKAKYNIE